MLTEKVCFNDALSQIYKPIEVMGVMIDPVEALKALYPEHYKGLLAEWNRQGDFGDVQLDFFAQPRPALKLVYGSKLENQLS